MKDAAGPELNPYLSPPPVVESALDSEVVAQNQRRNFAALAVYQIVMRAGWIFKTESIIMPAVLDLLSGSAWVRAMLPLLNRLGHSIPPMLMARRVKLAPYKSRMLLSTTLVMATCFLLLAIVWAVYAAARPAWMPGVFLAFYGVFFAVLGVNQLVFGTAQGKLIEVTRRGWQLLVANVTGAVIAIACALVLLPLWLNENTANVPAIFGFASACFFLSALATLWLVEPPDRYVDPPSTFLERLHEAWGPFRDDPNFRLLAFVSAMYGASMMLFPHYQSVGREELRLPLKSLISWLIVQNLGTGVFSLVAGLLADRFGNRLVLRLTMLGLCAAPILTLVLTTAGATGGRYFDFVFLLVGLTPLTFKTLQNYTLEICLPEDHSRYLSAISLSMAAPIVLSPLMGWGIEAWGFEVVFIIITAMVFSGWCVTYWLAEPRRTGSTVAVLNEEIES
jgi:hypothetical protein